MSTWLSRLMTLVFLFNILSPAYAQVPLHHPLDPYKEAKQQAKVSNERVLEIVTEGIREMAPLVEELETAQQDFFAATSFEDMSSAYERMKAIRRQGRKKVAPYRDKLPSQVYRAIEDQADVHYTYYQLNPHVAPDAISQTLGYDARFGSNPKKWPYDANRDAKALSQIIATCPSSQEILDALENNIIQDPEDLLNYLDPFCFGDEDYLDEDYLTVAYAAETMYYMLEQFTRPDSISEEEREEMTVFFSKARYRAVSSLKHLNSFSPSSDDERLYMALGTLRILISRIEAAASANNLQLLEKKIFVLTPTKKAWKESSYYPAKKRKLEGGKTFFSAPYEDFVSMMTQVVTELSSQVQQDVSQGYVNVQEVTYSSYYGENIFEKFTNMLKHIFEQLPPDMLRSLHEGIPPDLSEQFYDELKSLGAKAIDSGSADSAESALLSLDLQYAVQYAVLNGDQELLKSILALFEPKVEEDLNTLRSGFIATIFNSIYETLRGFYVRKSNADNIIDFLLDAAKASHSTATRVLAVGTLSTLTELADSADNTERRFDFSTTEEGDVSNKYWLSYEDRREAGKETVNLYDPLQKTGNYSKKNYGLDAEQMLKLSNSLAAVYWRFLPLEAPTVTIGKCGRIENVDFDHHRIVTRDELSVTSAGSFYDADCPAQYSKGGVFVFGGARGYSEITELNSLNMKQLDEEYTAAGMSLFIEALSWTIGGAVFSAAFRGLRLLSGVVKSLPRAIRAGKIVYKSTKGTFAYRVTATANRAAASAKTGSKYMSNANFQAHLAQNGMAYDATSVASKPGLVKTTTAISHGAAPRIPSPSTRVTVTAADASSGLARQATFGVSPNITRWSVPVQRAQFLRFTQQHGLRNVWSSADRSLFQENIWFKAFENKYAASLRPDRVFEMGYGTEFDVFTGRFINGPITKEILIPKLAMPGSLLAEHPVLSAGLTAYGKTLRFFGGWKALDVFSGILWREPFNQWLFSQQEAAVKKESEKYGDSLSSEVINEVEQAMGSNNEASPGDILASVGGAPKESFGWTDLLTLPSYMAQKIAPSQPDVFDGSLILPPFMAGRILLAEEGVGTNPLITDATKKELAISAHRMDLARASLGRIKTQLAKSEEDSIKVLKDLREDLQQTVEALQKQFPSVNWVAEEQAILKGLNDYEQALRATAKITNISERSKKLADVIKQYEEQLNGMYEQFHTKQEDADTSAQLDDAIKGYEVEMENTLWGMEMFGWKDTDVLYIRLGEIYTNLIDGLKKVQKKRISAAAKVQEATKYIQEFNQAKELFDKEAEVSQVSQAEAGDIFRSELYPEESTEVPSQAY